MAVLREGEEVDWKRVGALVGCALTLAAIVAVHSWLLAFAIGVIVGLIERMRSLSGDLRDAADRIEALAVKIDAAAPEEAAQPVCEYTGPMPRAGIVHRNGHRLFAVVKTRGTRQAV